MHFYSAYDQNKFLKHFICCQYTHLTHGEHELLGDVVVRTHVATYQKLQSVVVRLGGKRGLGFDPQCRFFMQNVFLI